MWQTVRTQTRWLEGLYLILILASVGSIAAMHSLPASRLDVLRIPSYLQRIDSPVLIGSKDPPQLLIYHVFLGLYFVVMMGNQFGLHCLHIPAWRRLAVISSATGIVVFGMTFELFAYPLVTSRRHGFAPIDLETSRIYAVWSMGLLLVDIATLILVRKSFDKLAQRDPIEVVLLGDVVPVESQGE